MQIFRGVESLPELGETVVTVGSFDGVHSGHLSLLRTLRERASVEKRRSVVVSFSPHPRVTLSGKEPQLLTSDREKAELLEAEGVDILIFIEFNREFSLLSYEDFLISHLQQRVGMAELIVGFNNNMGHDNGDFDKLSQCAKEHNFAITRALEYSAAGERVSSTLIRSHVERGEIESVNRLLSHPYLIIGEADDIGKVIIKEQPKLIPPMGVHRVAIDNIIQSIVIDPMQQIWCEERNREVKINFIGNNEE